MRGCGHREPAGGCGGILPPMAGLLGREKTMKYRAKTAGSKAMVQSIDQAIIRIDNVPKGIESKVLWKSYDGIRI